MARVVHTPPPPVTPDENPPVSVSVPTTVEDKPPIFTTQLTTQIEQLAGMSTGTKQRGQNSESELSSGKTTPRKTPTKNVTCQEQFSEKIKLEPKALTYYHEQMHKMAHHTLRFKGYDTRLRTELKQSRPNAVEAEELWRKVERHYHIIKEHREDAIKYFSPETQRLDQYMEEKTQMLEEAQENFLAVYTVLSLHKGEEGATHSERQTPDENFKELEKRTSTPSMFEMGFGNPQLTYMGENRRMALEPPGLASALIPEDKEDYKLLPRVMNQTLRPPPPPPKLQGMIPHRPLVPHQGSVQQLTARPSIHMCQICQTDQLTMDRLERHINDYHSRQKVGPPQGYHQPYIYPGPPNQGQWYAGPPNQGNWYAGPQNQGMDMERMFKMMGDSFAEIMSRNDERNKEEQRRQHEDRLQEQRAMAMVHFDKTIQNTVKPFNPNSFKEEGKKIAAYKMFQNSMKELNLRMENLDMTENMKYETLVRLVQGDALETIYRDNPTEATFQESLRKLDDQYLSKSLGIRDLYHQLRHLPNLHEHQSKQVTKTVTMSLNLMEQLMAVEVTAEEVWFLIFSELLVPKMNKIAFDIWEKLVDKNIDESKPWGHTLNNEHLRSTLRKVKTLMHNREITASYNKAPAKDDKQQSQSKSPKEKKKEEEERRKNVVYGHLTNADGADRDGMPRNQSKPDQCPVPLCEASNKSVKNDKGRYRDTEVAHRFLLHCPKIQAMSIAERRKFYKQNGCTCYNCFSTTHKFDECPLQIKFPRLCNVKRDDGTTCNGKHHQMLHLERTQNNRNQNTGTSGSQAQPEQPQQ